MNTNESVCFSLNPLDHFISLEDPRVERTKRHELMDIIVIAVSAVICGAEGWTEVADFGRIRKPWFESFLALPNGIPSHDTFGRVFSRLDPEQFQRCFVSWISALHRTTAGQVIAIDGKTLRGTLEKSAGKAAIHLVSAWASDNNLMLGQVKVDGHSNEITAIPKLLDLLDLKGNIVTIDAMGTQQPIAQKIREHNADYLLALKANQKTLHGDAKAFFDRCEQHDFRNVDHSFHQSIEKDHGRIETRRCWAIAPVGRIRDWEHWPDLRSFVLVEAQREIAGKITCERRYYISSLPPEAKELLAIVRRHWSIENSFHWILDVAMHEDDCRIRKDHSAENFALLRRLALGLLKNETTMKRGIKAKQKIAAWDQDYLLKVLIH